MLTLLGAFSLNGVLFFSFATPAVKRACASTEAGVYVTPGCGISVRSLLVRHVTWVMLQVWSTASHLNFVSAFSSTTGEPVLPDLW